MEMTPRQIVAELNKYIIGQDAAKRAVAVALRNRYRRSRLPADVREEIIPKNILMIGPTGVGKTEIARRLAKLVDAPFVKVEATKFTEVGYVGRDVDSIIRDLVETSLRIVKERMGKDVEQQADFQAQERILDALLDKEKAEASGAEPRKAQNPIEALLAPSRPQPLSPEESQKRKTRREELRNQLLAGDLEGELIEIEVEDQSTGDTLPGTDISMSDMLGSIMPKKKKLRRVTVLEARRVLCAEEANKLIDMDAATTEALARAEQDGIVFLDEIDKIAGRSQSGQIDVSREGVQRDILPIVEGSTVNTKYGPVKTDHILFIAAGAFHVAKVTDLIPELQGRFPVHVELSPLTKEDMRRILTQPENALIKQYQLLMAVDGATIRFTEEGLDELAALAVSVNENRENIGARRLHTLIEYVLEDVAFEADGQERAITISRDYVQDHLKSMVKSIDVSTQII